MSLLSTIILPKLEKEFVNLEPQIADFILKQLYEAGKDILGWVENKINLYQSEQYDARSDKEGV